jgi:metallo-beta-lactamase family protein
LANTISNPRNTVLVVGYCEPNSLGARIRNKDPFVRIYGEEYALNAEVEIMDSYSAHGDYQEMIDYLSCQKKDQVKEIFLVHGEYETQVNYREKLLAEGYQKITIPERGHIALLD